MTIALKQGNLTDSELNIAKRNLNFDKFHDLVLVFNTANYFQIFKFYINGFFMGYAILFLGYNSILTNDVSIEDISFFGNNELLFQAMPYLLNKIRNIKTLVFPNKEIYFDINDFEDKYSTLFKNAQYKLIRSLK